MPSVRDVKLGRIADKTVENNVAVRPSAQINELSLAQKQARLAAQRLPLLDREEAMKLYGPDEVDEWFGAAAEPAAQPPGPLTVAEYLLDIARAESLRVRGEVDPWFAARWVADRYAEVAEMITPGFYRIGTAFTKEQSKKS